MPETKDVEAAYKLAKSRYESLGVDLENAMQQLEQINISLHCWQADDVGGFEKAGAKLEGGGIAVTGNYPGKARNIQEMRQDLEKVYSLLPGHHRLNLHASYGEFGGKSVERDAIAPEHFEGWADWARENNLGLDFNCTLFSHPKADAGFTLSSKDNGIRNFWIEHVKRCREIGAHLGKSQKSTCIHNIWIPDGMKDTTIDRMGYRAKLLQSLDEIFETKYPEKFLKDAVESKLFGIGSEAFVVGSHEFYLGYAIKNNKLICIDNGHFHPTEVIGDKISAILQYVDEMLLHMTRGVRWDSDHVVTQNDEIMLICQELVRCQALQKVFIGLDFFDASINRLGAYVIGARAVLKSLLYALLEPVPQLKGYEEKGLFFQRLAFLEEMKSMPFGAVWDYYCMKNDVPVAEDYIKEIEDYEKDVLSGR